MTAAVPQPELPERLAVDQYHELIRNGILSDADPVELLEGVLVRRMPKTPAHSATTGRVRQAVHRLLPTGLHYHSHDPVTLPDGEPEPDGAVIRGRIEDYTSRHPGPHEVPLIIEVADSSLDRDHGIKLRSYARGGIAEYWIVNLIARSRSIRIPMRRRPSGRRIANVVYASGDAVPLVIDGSKLGDVPVSAVLP